MTIFYDIPGFEKLYQITDAGQVLSLKSNQILKPYPIHSGYLLVDLRKENKRYTRLVHKLVMETFIGSSKKQVNHKNGVKTDNRLENLEYCTAKENVAHAKQMGLINNQGENSTSSKLTTEQVKYVKSCKKRHCDLARELNVNASTIIRIRQGKLWAHV